MAERPTRGGDGPGFTLIAGTSYCGSTLLALLLDSHPEIVSVSELQGPLAGDKAAYRCSCGERLGDCPFWRRVVAAMKRRGVSFGLDDWRFLFDRGRRGPLRYLLVRSLLNNRLDRLRDGLVERFTPLGRELRMTGLRNTALVESVREVSGKRIFVDGSKDPVRARFLRRYTDLDPRVVHLVRDAPGFVHSWNKNLGADLDSAIRSWNRMAGHCERLFRELPASHRLRIRYEDLCADPAAVTERIAAFAGAGPYPAPVDPDAREHHVIGNRMRLRPVREIKLDESWRQALEPSAIDTILKRTRRFRRRFGYA